MQRHLLPLLPLAITLLLASCSSGTIESRITASQSLFDTYSPEIQKTIRDGFISANFNREQVEIALGEPIETKPQVRNTYGVSQSCTYNIYLPDEKNPSAPRKKHTVTISYMNNNIFRAVISK